jgi:transcriptional regulator with XRE-family HTH domain
MANRSASSRVRAREQSARIGAEVKLARVTQAMTRQQVADLAGVAWSTEVRVELGDPNLGIETMCAVAEAVGLDVVLRAYQGTTPPLRDTGQLEITEQLVAQASPLWQPEIELLIGQHGESIDLAFFGPAEIIATEVERMAADWQNQYRRADRKREALAAQHRRPVRLVLAVADTRRNRGALGPHMALVKASLPAGSRDVLAALRSGRPLGQDGLLWIRRGWPTR